MNIEKNIKLWSSLGMRATFGLIAMELAKKYPDLIITTSDVSTSAGLDRYKNKYPEQFIDVGIAEQNLIGVSLSNIKMLRANQSKPRLHEE